MLPFYFYSFILLIPKCLSFLQFSPIWCSKYNFVTEDSPLPFITTYPCISSKNKSYFASCSSDIIEKSHKEDYIGLTDEEFQNWLTNELHDAPGRQIYKETFDNAIYSIIKWRQRYRGNPSVWKRIFKKDRVIKELIESAPILHSVQLFVNSNEVNEDTSKITIVDLCSGKGYLSMFLSEMLPAEKVSKLILVDKAWAMCNSEVLSHHMNWDHIYGSCINENDTNMTSTSNPYQQTNSSTNEIHSTYFTTWPIPLHTSKQDLKQSCNHRQMKKYIFDRINGPIIMLAIHLCGTLSLKAIDLFNDNENVTFFCLKPCCLPKMIHAQRGDIFQIGNHSFHAKDVCSNGKFNKKDWTGPPRWHLEQKFHLWSDHLYKGINLSMKKSTHRILYGPMPDKTSVVDDYMNIIKEKATLGKKEKREIQVQIDGGFQNTYLLAERVPLTNKLWDDLK